MNQIISIVIWFHVFISNINTLEEVIWFQVTTTTTTNNNNNNIKLKESEKKDKYLVLARGF